MGYQTDFIGYLHMTPPLNAREMRLTYPPLACQVEIDRFRDWVLERRQNQ